MQQVQKHLIKPNHRNYQEIDVTCLASKNLYNCGIYLCRQAFFESKKVPPFKELYHLLKNSDDYQDLPIKVAQLVIKQVSKVFKSYFAAIKAYKKNPKKFLGKPKLPKYKHKEKGRNKVSYNYQAVSRTWLKKGWLSPSGLNLKIPTKLTKVHEVRIIPKGNGKYYCELVGVKVTITEESYTSKCSFLDLEAVTKHDTYVGKQIKRGLFESSNGIKYNADLNGTLNILRKVADNSVFDRKLVERLVVSPVRFTPYKA